MNEDNIQIIKNNEIDFKVIFHVLWNDRWRMILITIIATMIGIIFALRQTPLYKSSISIYPSGDNDISQMAELKSMASAFGFNAASNQRSIEIEDILYSRNLQKKLIYNKWVSSKWHEPIDLISYWKKNNESKLSYNPLDWIKTLFKTNELSEPGYKNEIDAMNNLSSRIEMKKSQSGLYTISVWMEERKLASDIANMIYDFLVEFNTVSSVNNSKMNRTFIQDRLKDIGARLETAEERLKDFREKNRSIIESPQLQLELGRLTRDVEIQNQLYITLLEQLELVKIKELDETPTLTVLDTAVPSLYKDKPKRKNIVLLSFMVGIMVSICIVFGKFWYTNFSFQDN